MNSSTRAIQVHVPLFPVHGRLVRGRARRGTTTAPAPRIVPPGTLRKGKSKILGNRNLSPGQWGVIEHIQQRRTKFKQSR
jgi:hypothetical protein